jgi:hypothetical protein
LPPGNRFTEREHERQANDGADSGLGHRGNGLRPELRFLLGLPGQLIDLRVQLIEQPQQILAGSSGIDSSWRRALDQKLMRGALPDCEPAHATGSARPFAIAPVYADAAAHRARPGVEIQMHGKRSVSKQLEQLLGVAGVARSQRPHGIT